jgi:hypothetical protein
MRVAVFDDGVDEGCCSPRDIACRASSVMRVEVSCPLLGVDAPDAGSLLRVGVWRQAGASVEKPACIIAIASPGDAPSLLFGAIASV